MERVTFGRPRVQYTARCSERCGPAAPEDRASGGRRVDLPRTAEVVIIGGGAIGASTAYHLTQLGVRDVLVLERDALRPAPPAAAWAGCAPSSPPKPTCRSCCTASICSSDSRKSSGWTSASTRLATCSCCTHSSSWTRFTATSRCSAAWGSTSGAGPRGGAPPFSTAARHRRRAGHHLVRPRRVRRPHLGHQRFRRPRPRAGRHGTGGRQRDRYPDGRRPHSWRRNRPGQRGHQRRDLLRGRLVRRGGAHGRGGPADLRLAAAGVLHRSVRPAAGAVPAVDRLRHAFRGAPRGHAADAVPHQPGRAAQLQHPLRRIVAGAPHPGRHTPPARSWSTPP